MRAVRREWWPTMRAPGDPLPSAGGSGFRRRKRSTRSAALRTNRGGSVHSWFLFCRGDLPEGGKAAMRKRQRCVTRHPVEHGLQLCAGAIRLRVLSGRNGPCFTGVCVHVVEPAVVPELEPCVADHAVGSIVAEDPGTWQRSFPREITGKGLAVDDEPRGRFRFRDFGERRKNVREIDEAAHASARD